jgi:hypothetical protein
VYGRKDQIITEAEVNLIYFVSEIKGMFMNRIDSADCRRADVLYLHQEFTYRDPNDENNREKACTNCKVSVRDKNYNTIAFCNKTKR